MTNPYRVPAPSPGPRSILETFPDRWTCGTCGVQVIGDTPAATLAGVIRHVRECSR